MFLGLAHVHLEHDLRNLTLLFSLVIRLSEIQGLIELKGLGLCGFEGNEAPIAVELQVLLDFLEGELGGETREQVLVQLREDACILVLQVM